MVLMPHQLQGVKFATARKGSLLSGQPGSGKTAIAVVSSLTWLVANPTWNRVIICVPASLKENWRREWESWAASMPVLPTQELKIGVVAGGGEWPEDCQVIIISYDLVYSDDYKGQIYDQPWDVLIVDECFPAGTMVLTPSGPVNIEDIRIGDEVISAAGISVVTGSRQSISRQIATVETSHGSIDCTNNHPFFTNQGWVNACNLNQSHLLKTHDEIMLLVQCESSEVKGCKILREELFSEMENVSTINQSSDAREDSIGTEKRNIQEDARQISKPGERIIGAHDGEESNVDGWSEGESMCHTPEDWTQAKCKEGEWNGSNNGREDCSRYVPRVHSQFCSENRWRNRVSEPLQGGCCLASPEDGTRDGRVFSQCLDSTGSRQEKGGEAVQSGVGNNEGKESVRVRSSRGIKGPDSGTTVFNLQVSNHPSYFVLIGDRWVLVHNCHFIKSPKAKRTKAIASIKARRKMLLSGTPAPNRPCELFPQLNILNPKVWDSWYKYIQRYCDAKKGYNNSWDFSGASNTKELYERLTQGPDAIMFRVLKKDCLDLKEKQHKIIEVPPPEECNTLLDREKMLFKMRDTTLDNLRRIREEAQYGDEENYKENASNLNSTQTAAMSEMARIRRELAVAKAPLVVDHAMSLLDSGTNKLVVAGHHREALSIVADQLQSYGAMLYMGGVGLLKRQEMVDKFQQDPAARVMVLGIMAGGVGITLTASSHVIMSESTWNTATNTQAVDRLDRMGQTEQVKIDWLVFKGSLDAMVLKKCLSKDKVVDAIIDGVESKDTPQESKPQKIKTDYKALGLKMSDAQKQAALDALRHIALLDSDGAKKANGLGFNRFHSQIGRELASKVALTPAQAALAREIATKYKTQLTPSLRIALQS